MMRLIPHIVGPALIVSSWTLIVGTDFAAGQPSYGRARDPHGFQVFLQEGGWCWFQDPRAIVHRGTLFVGGVQGSGSGDAVVGVYNLEKNELLGRIVLHKGFKHDDHNSPVFYTRPDGSVLAMYALHGDNRTHYYRISHAANFLEWGEEQQYEHTYPEAGNVTYMNLVALEEEHKLYNFFRGIDWNPCFVSSSDHGLTWQEPTHFIQSELEGRQRPYARYTSNNRNTIHVCFTDGHPHVFGNSIYYAAFSKGMLCRADGSPIKNLQEGGPLKPSEAETVFQGGGAPGHGQRASAERSAWTSSIAVDRNGHPHIGYTLYLSNTDHRYRIASWNGTRWVDREVAYGGKCLYENESSYTGLITLDENDPTQVVISTDVDPATGEDHGGKHEIYRACVGMDSDLAGIDWEPVTTNSPVRNLRPVVVSGDGYRVILWLRGDFVTYTSYQLDVLGIVERTEKDTRPGRSTQPPAIDNEW